jgi:AcrR family transcriptional regulator
MELPASIQPATDDRPMRADARRNRERILTAAREAFAEFGQLTQMDDVAARASVGVGTVYRHFPTKEALVSELVRQKFVFIRENAERALEQEGDPFEIFAAMVTRTHEAFEKDAAAQDALMRAQITFTGEVEAEQERLAAVVQQLIERAQTAGTMRRDFTSWDMPMLMCGISSTMSHGGPGFDWRRHLEILLDGLRTR